MNKKRCNALLPLVQLLPAVAAAAALLFALPRTVPVLAAVPERLTAVVEQPSEAASSEAEEEVLPKLPYADGIYVGSSRGYGGAVRVQVTMENGSITEVEILDASHETKQFLRRAKRLLTTVVEAQSWEVDAVSEATYTSRGILGAVQNALTGEVVNNPLWQYQQVALVQAAAVSQRKQEIAEVEAYNASVLQAQSAAQAEQTQSGYRDGTYEGSAFGFGDVIRVSVTIQNGKMTDIAVLDASGEDKPYYKQALPLLDEMLSVQSAGVDTVSGATLTAEGLIGAVEDALGKAAG